MSARPERATVFRLSVWAGGIVLVTGCAIWLAFQISPWPQALLIRNAFEQEAARVSQQLEKHVPAGVASRPDVRYAEGDDAFLDVFYPASVEGTGTVLPTIVWVHGGAWISGSRKNVGNYLRILASHGYAAVAVGYSIAPGATYPTPLRQVNAALAFLQASGSGLHVDPSRIVLAGDSAGAQIAAQVANMISVASYADAIGVKPALARDRLKGVLLNCGAYDAKAVNLDGPLAGFLRTVMWSYSGNRGFATDPYFATVSVVDYVTAAFPPAFITGGNGDPLTPQSKALAAALARRGAVVETLFFPDDLKPPLPHEYQFNLDTEAGQTALKRTLAFLRRVFGQV